MAIAGRGPNAGGAHARRRALLGLPLLAADTATARPAFALTYTEPSARARLRDFLSGVRFLSVNAPVYLWQDGRWTKTHASAFPGQPPEARPGGLLRHDLDLTAKIRAAEAAERALAERLTRDGRGGLSLRVSKPFGPTMGAGEADSRSWLTITAQVHVRDAVAELPPAAAPADVRLLVMMDRVEFFRGALVNAPNRGVWPLSPDLVVEAAAASKAEERVLARLGSVSL